MADVNLSKELYELNVNVKTGSEAREPIAQMLEKVNSGGGNVSVIVDGDENYIYKDFMTPDEVYSYFINGEGLIDKMPEKASERTKGVTSKAIYRQMVIMSNILSKIIGEEAGGEEN